MSKRNKVDVPVVDVPVVDVPVVDVPVVDVPVVAPTVVTVAKALLAVAGMQPSATLQVAGTTLPNPLHVPHGASKRSMALAVYNAVCAKGFTDVQAQRLASVVLVLTGVGYCHATRKVLVGEVRGKRGLVGYIKPCAAWWNSASNTAKAALVQGYANTVVTACIGDTTDFGAALPKVETMLDKYLVKYGADTTDLG
jgi:hypothetical protein